MVSSTALIALLCISGADAASFLQRKDFTKGIQSGHGDAPAKATMMMVRKSGEDPCEEQCPERCYEACAAHCDEDGDDEKCEKCARDNGCEECHACHAGNALIQHPPEGAGSGPDGAGGQGGHGDAPANATMMMVRKSGEDPCEDSSDPPMCRKCKEQCPERCYIACAAPCGDEGDDYKCEKCAIDNGCEECLHLDCPGLPWSHHSPHLPPGSPHLPPDGAGGQGVHGDGPAPGRTSTMNEELSAFVASAKKLQQDPHVQQDESGSFASYDGRVVLQLIFGVLYYFLIVKHYPMLNNKEPTKDAIALQQQDAVSATFSGKTTISNCLLSWCCTGPRAAHTFHSVGILDYWPSCFLMSCFPCCTLWAVNSFSDLNVKLGGEKQNPVLGAFFACCCSCCLVAQDAQSLDLITGVETTLCGIEESKDSPFSP